MKCKYCGEDRIISTSSTTGCCKGEWMRYLSTLEPWSGLVTVGQWRMKFHKAGGFGLEYRVNDVIGWIVDDETPYRDIPPQLLDAIRAFRPNYPLDEVMREENAE